MMGWSSVFFPDRDLESLRFVIRAVLPVSRPQLCLLLGCCGHGRCCCFYFRRGDSQGVHLGVTRSVARGFKKPSHIDVNVRLCLCRSWRGVTMTQFFMGPSKVLKHRNRFDIKLYNKLIYNNDILWITKSFIKIIILFRAKILSIIRYLILFATYWTVKHDA